MILSLIIRSKITAIIQLYHFNIVTKAFILLDKLIYKSRRLSKILQNILDEIYLYKLALPKKI